LILSCQNQPLFNEWLIVGNHGQSDATAPRCPFDLIYCEYHASKADALRREGYFKTTAGKNGIETYALGCAPFYVPDLPLTGRMRQT